MVWFLVDDNLTFHGKTVEAGNAAMGLWVRAGSWSAATLTNGFVPSKIARKLGRKTDAERLVFCGFWEEVPSGYQFHDWASKQQTKADVEARRRWERERKAAQRRRANTDPCPDGTPAGHARRPTRALPKPSQPVVTTGGLAHQPNATRRDRPPGRVVEIEESPPPTEDRAEYINAAQNGMPQIRAALTRKPQPL